MMHVWDLRVQSRLNLGESKSQMRIDAVINLMNPKTTSNYATVNLLPFKSIIRQGKRQTLDTLINEEALLLARFLRNEKKEWKPRLPNIN